MYYEKLHEAHLMCCLLSYVTDHPAYLTRNCQGWTVLSKTELDDKWDVELHIIQLFESKKHDPKNKPKWWTDAVLEEIATFKLACQKREDDIWDLIGPKPKQKSIPTSLAEQEAEEDKEWRKYASFRGHWDGFDWIYTKNDENGWVGLVDPDDD